MVAWGMEEQPAVQGWLCVADGFETCQPPCATSGFRVHGAWFEQAEERYRSCKPNLTNLTARFGAVGDRRRYRAERLPCSAAGGLLP